MAAAILNGAVKTMKILELPQFENIERMTRKEIVALVKPLIEKAPNRAQELRLNLALLVQVARLKV